MIRLIEYWDTCYEKAILSINNNDDYNSESISGTETTTTKEDIYFSGIGKGQLQIAPLN